MRMRKQILNLFERLILVVVLPSCSVGMVMSGKEPPTSFNREGCTADLLDQVGSQVEDLARQLSTDIEKNGVSRVAILPLYNFRYKKARPIGNYLTEKLTISLYKTGSTTVVERTQLDKVMAEVRLTNSGRFEDASVKRIGKLLGVDAVIMGSYTELGSRLLEVNSRIINVETGEIVGAGTIQLPTAGIASLLEWRLFGESWNGKGC